MKNIQEDAKGVMNFIQHQKRKVRFVNLAILDSLCSYWLIWLNHLPCKQELPVQIWVGAFRVNKTFADVVQW